MKQATMLIVLCGAGLLFKLLTDRLSSDAVGMALGLLFGLLAGLPTVLLLLVASSRRQGVRHVEYEGDYDGDYLPVCHLRALPGPHLAGADTPAPRAIVTAWPDRAQWDAGEDAR